MMVEDAVRRRRRRPRHDAAAQRRAQAAAAAAPAAVGRRAAARDGPARRRAGPRRARLAFVEPEDARRLGRRVRRDHRPRTAASRPASPSTANIAVALPMMVHADEARGDRARHRRRALLRLRARPLRRLRRAPARAHVDLGRVPRAPRRRRLRARRSSADGAPLQRQACCAAGSRSLRGAIGTPDQVRELVAPLRGGGRRRARPRPDRATAHEHILEALELFAAEVMPEFAARRPTREAAKRARAGRRATARAWRAAPPRRRVDPATTRSAGDAAPTRRRAPRSPRRRRRRSPCAPAARAARRCAARWRPRGEQAFRRFVARARTTRGSSARSARPPGLRVDLRRDGSAGSSPSAPRASPATSSTTCARRTATCARGR